MDLLEPTRLIDVNTPKGKYVYSYLMLGEELNLFLEQGGSLDSGLDTTVGWLLIQVPQDSPMYQILTRFYAECRTGAVKEDKQNAGGLYEWLSTRISEGYNSTGNGGHA